MRRRAKKLIALCAALAILLGLYASVATLTAEPEEALSMALAQEKGPVFITDSGDNVTSGATGWNTYILRQVLAVKDLNKKVLFAF